MPAAPPAHAAEDVAAADHDADLDAELGHLRDLGDDALDGRAVDAVGVIAHQGFAGELEQDALVRGASRQSRRSRLAFFAAAACAATSAAKSVDFLLDALADDVQREAMTRWRPAP